MADFGPDDYDDMDIDAMCAEEEEMNFFEEEYMDDVDPDEAMGVADAAVPAAAPAKAPTKAPAVRAKAPAALLEMNGGQIEHVRLQRSTEKLCKTEASPSYTSSRLLSTAYATKTEGVTKVDASAYLDSRSEEGGKHTACVLADGSRFFMRRRSIEQQIEQCTSSSSVHEISKMSGLLAQPWDELMQMAERKQADREVAQQLKQEVAALGDGADGEGKGKGAVDARDGQGRSHALSGKNLWVDKYSPKAFHELLSPEKINREVLTTVKEWDSFVFREGAEGGGSGAGRGSSSSGSGGRAGADSKSSGGVERDENAPAHDKRPANKVILLCGPPGTGKTTLAHVVARHCGYRVEEVNASDDRSPAIIRDRLARAMTGNTIDGDKKPNCIVLDEIDGIDGRATMDALLAIIKAPLRAPKKARSGHIPLTRPLICICNNQFAPALRELRRNATVFAFAPPTELRLVQRLKAICAGEGLHASSTALTALGSAAGLDIRSSLNTLQFAALRMKQSLSEAKSGKAKSAANLTQVLNSMIRTGLKDEQQDVYKIWRQIFSAREASSDLASANKRKAAALDDKGDTHTAAAATAAASPLAGRGNRLTMSGLKSMRDSRGNVGPSSSLGATSAHVSKCVAEYGDSQLVMQGIFENLLSCRLNDPTGIKLYAASEWLSYGQVIESLCYSMDDGFVLAKYMPSVAGAVHMFASSETLRPRTAWPTRDRDARYKRQQQEAVVSCLLEGAGTHAIGGRRSAALESRSAIVLDGVTAVADVISPRIRPVPLVSMNATEQDALGHTVQVMRSLGLSYQMTGSDGTATSGAGGAGAAAAAAKKQQSEGQTSSFKPNGGDVGPQLDPCLLVLAEFAHPDLLAKRRESARGGFNKNFSGMADGDDAAAASYYKNSRSRSQNTQERDFLREPSQRIADPTLTADPLAAWMSADVRRNIFLAVREASVKETAAASSGAIATATAAATAAAASPTTAEKARKVRLALQPTMPVLDETKAVKYGAKDFFGRPKVASTAPKRKLKPQQSSGAGAKASPAGADTASMQQQPAKKHRIMFKYQAGFSSAVRRPVSISDFI